MLDLVSVNINVLVSTFNVLLKARASIRRRHSVPYMRIPNLKDTDGSKRRCITSRSEEVTTLFWDVYVSSNLHDDCDVLNICL